jgi:hypothetical protein
MASTRVVRGPGEIPIHTLFIALLLVRAHRGRRDDASRANFSATSVRYIFRSSLPQARDASSGGAAALEASRVPSLRRAPRLATHLIVATVGAISVTAITKAAEVEEATALVTNALDLP